MCHSVCDSRAAALLHGFFDGEIQAASGWAKLSDAQHRDNLRAAAHQLIVSRETENRTGRIVSRETVRKTAQGTRKV